MKKALAVILTSIMVFCIFFALTVDVGAINYNASAAVNYANAHWDDGVGKCATFVSQCLKAGGCGAWSSSVEELRRLLKNGGYGTEYLLTENGQSIYESQNSGKISVGDPIFFYCKKCKGYPHVVICTGFNSKGQALACGHNVAWNNVTYIAGYYHMDGAHIGDDILVYSFHMSGKPTVSDPWIKASSSAIFLGNNISFDFGADNATSYTLTVKHLNQTVLTKDNAKSGTSYNFTEEGTYTAYITAKNANDSVDSATVSFYIVDALDCGAFFTTKLKNPVSGYYVAADNTNNVYLASQSANANNEWKFIRQEDLSYKVVNIKNGNCLGVYNGGTANGTNIGCYPSDDSDSQRWYIRKNISGYALVPKIKLSSDLSITGNNSIYGECIFDGANISLYDNDSVQSQRFEFEYILPPINSSISIDKEKLTSEEKLKFDFGVDYAKSYTLHAEFIDGSIVERAINPGDSVSFEKSGRWSAYIICTLEDGTKINTDTVYFYNMKIYDFGESFTAKIKNTSSGFFIATKNTGNGQYNAFVASQETCDNNLWQFDRQVDGSYKIINKQTGYVLSLYDEKVEDGTNIICSTDDNSDTQKWFITENIDGYAFAPKSDYTKYISVFDNNTIWWYGEPTDGASVILYDLDNVQSQRFEFVDYEKAAYIPGDINDSGAEPDLDDVVALAQIVAGWQNVAHNAVALDVNGDTTVTLDDVVLLAQFVAGWAVELK